MTPNPPPRIATRTVCPSSEAGNADPVPESGAAWEHPRVATLLPAELLQGGETIVLLLKPSPWFILIRSMRFLVIVAVVLAAILWLREAGYVSIMSRREMVLSAFGTGAAFLFWQFFEWLGRVYVLTDLRVIRVKGVVRIQVFEAPLRRIQHTDTTFAFSERLFGLGSIGFATASDAGFEASWQMVADPLQVHQVVVRTLNRYQ